MKCVVAKANILLLRGGSCRNGVGNSISLVLLPRPTFISCRVGSPYGVWASLWRHVQIRTLCKLLRHTLQFLVQISPLKKKISFKPNEKHFLQKLFPSCLTPELHDVSSTPYNLQMLGTTRRRAKLSYLQQIY
jgi:hypothetical protein